ncbi:MAG: aminopeptidase [Flavipsychrobacter sp.]|nr:aminopeptidase [Flavipsychrobacter sp.]
MSKLSVSLLLSLLLLTLFANGQEIETAIRGHIADLASPVLHGRGYVKDGKEDAAKYMLKRFQDIGLQSVTNDKVYAQAYTFPVNTFPGKMKLTINDDSLKPGVDFLIDASSASYFAKDLPVTTVNLKKIKDTASWRALVAKLDTSHAYCFRHLDDFLENTGIRKDKFVYELPMGCFIIPEDGKLTWTISRDSIPATVFHVKDVPKKLKAVSVNVSSVFVPASRNANIIGQVPGALKDSFIVFTAHYDHLGMMGDKVYFPGASDNASGCAMLLSLAAYYVAHPGRYSMLFIAFSGEEAGLMGSEFYTWKPLVPLANMKFLTNIDIMGDATNGITVVNATKYPSEFDELQQINEKNKYVPEIRSRGPAANSDHYYFTEAGVHSFFIYSNGGNGYYHDIFDVSKEVTLRHIGGVQKLLIDFVKEMK